MSGPIDLTVLGLVLGKTVCGLAGTTLSKALAADIAVIEATEGSDV